MPGDEIPQALTLHEGATARFPLSRGLSGGYAWTVSVDGTAVTATIERTPPPPGVMALSAETLVVQAVTPGTANVELRLARAWSPSKPASTLRVEVTVEG